MKLMKFHFLLQWGKFRYPNSGTQWQGYEKELNWCVEREVRHLRECVGLKTEFLCIREGAYGYSTNGKLKKVTSLRFFFLSFFGCFFLLFLQEPKLIQWHWVILNAS